MSLLSCQDISYIEDASQPVAHRVYSTIEHTSDDYLPLLDNDKYGMPFTMYRCIGLVIRRRGRVGDIWGS